MKSRRRIGHSPAHQREGDIMSVSGISSGNNLYPAALQSVNSQRRTDFQALGSALQSGDLTGAQAAFAALQRDLQGAGQTQAQSGVQSAAQSDYQNLASALQSGDLSSAQKAFAALQQDLQTVLHRHSHHHHHHHAGAVAPTAATGEASLTSTGSTSSTDSQSAGGSIDLRG
jgi:ribosomal protein S20